MGDAAPPHPIKFVHFADSELVVGLSCGDARTNKADLSQYAESLQWSLHCFRAAAGFKGWYSDNKLLPLCVHVPRAGNMVADFLVNKVLNERRNCKILCPGIARLVQNGYVKLVLYTDGGSRGNRCVSLYSARCWGSPGVGLRFRTGEPGAPP